MTTNGVPRIRQHSQNFLFTRTLGGHFLKCPGIGTSRVDAGGGPDAALGILTTIAVSMVSLATLVLTITMVVVQLAMGQFSPRNVETFLRDRPSQFAIGLFVATFAHTMCRCARCSSTATGRCRVVQAAICELPRDGRDLQRSLTPDGQGLGVVV